jgi:hypothetical protein
MLTQQSYHFIVGHHNVIILAYFLDLSRKDGSRKARSRHFCHGSYDGWGNVSKLGTHCWKYYLAQAL